MYKVNIKKILIVFLILLFTILSFSISSLLDLKRSSKNIDEILKTESYNYLPKEAKRYIKKYYEETGIILLTEKNKEENEPYLNPEYIKYLENGEEPSEYGYIPESVSVDYNYANTDIEEELPSYFDYRKYEGGKYLTSMKSQGSLGLCWDFAITGAVESAILKNNLFLDNSLDLSERQIDYISISTTSLMDTNYTKVSGLGGGGSIESYKNALKTGYSPILESLWPYDYYYSGPVKRENLMNYENVEFDVDGTHEFSIPAETNAGFKNAINTIKQELIKYGVGSITVGTSKGLKYNLVDGESPLIEGRNYNYIYSGGSINHEVEVIGWDDNYHHNICNATSKITDAKYNAEEEKYYCDEGTLVEINGAWIAKNSWGESSTSAIVYIPYRNSQSSIYVVSKVSKKDWDNVYYDSLSYSTNKNSEKLKKIKFNINKNDVDVNVYLSKTGKSTDYEKVGTVNIPYKGYYTLDLNDKDIVLENDFSIMLTDSNGNTISSSIKASVFTSNISDNVSIDINNAKLTNTLKNKSLADENNIIVLEGTSKGLNQGDLIDFIVKDSNGNDVTSKFKFSRNYSISNVINTIVSFNNDVAFGDYNVEVYYKDVKYDEFKITVNLYINDIKGSGTTDDPYVINTPSDLNLVRTSPDSSYVLGNDIDLTYDTQNENGLFYNNGNGWKSITNFAGNFDGNNHKIIGLYSTTAGLFSDVLYSSLDYTNKIGQRYIKNIIFDNINCTYGALAKRINYSHGTSSPSSENSFELSNIIVNSGSISMDKSNTYTSSGIVSSIYMGSVIYKIKINNLYNNATISDEKSAAGLIGSLTVYPYINNNLYTNIEISNLLNKGDVVAQKAAGLIGEIKNGNSSVTLYNFKISNAINYGNILGSNSAYEFISSYSNNSNLYFNNVYYYKGSPYNESDLIKQFATKYEFKELKNSENYNSWSGFSDYWKIEKINGVGRLPLLKNASIEYSNYITDKIDIYIDFEKSLYDYITPDTDAAKNISYYVDENDNISISDEGIIKGLKEGSTNLHILSYYDGFEKDVRINVNNATIDYYYIKYDANGGEGSVEKQAINYDEPIKLRKNLFSNGEMVFIHWNTKSDGTGTSYDELSEVKNVAGTDKEVILYAIWSEPMYTIRYESNGGEGSVESQQVRKGETIKLRKNNFTKKDYDFDGWVLKDDENIWFDEEEEVVDLAEPLQTVTLVPYWLAHPYTIIFDLNGGTGTYNYRYDEDNNKINNEIEIGFDEEYQLPRVIRNNIKRTGFTFKEWNTKPDGTGTSYKASDVISYLAKPYETITLYAIWNLNVIDNCLYDISNGYILNIKEETTLKTYLENISIKEGYKLVVYDEGDNELSIDDIITTGSKIKFYKNNNVIAEYINIVYGDVNGDGIINITDVSKLFSHISNNEEIKEDYYLKAADVNFDDHITITDIAKLFAYVIKNILSF